MMKKGHGKRKVPEQQQQQQRQYTRVKLETNLFDLPDEILNIIFGFTEPSSMRNLSKTSKIARGLKPKCNLFDHIEKPVNSVIGIPVQYEGSHILEMKKITMITLELFNIKIKLKNITGDISLCFKIQFYFDFHISSFGFNVDNPNENIIRDGNLNIEFLKDEIEFKFKSKCLDAELKAALNEISNLLNVNQSRTSIPIDEMFNEWKSLGIENPERFLMAIASSNIDNINESSPLGSLVYTILFLPIFSHEQIMNKLTHIEPSKYKQLIEQTKTGTKNLYKKTKLDINYELYTFLKNEFTEGEIFNAPKVCLVYIEKIKYQESNIGKSLKYWIKDDDKIKKYFKLFNIY